MCGSIGWPRSSATGANSAASLVALGATGARKSMRVRISTETSSCSRTSANSSAVSLPFLFRRWFGTTSLPTSCIRAAKRRRSSRAGDIPSSSPMYSA